MGEVIEPPTSKRFWSKVSVADLDECWEWRGGRSNGYGSFAVSYDEWEYAHRLMWKLMNGREPKGDISHECHNRLCVNPAHLIEATRQENVRKSYRDGHADQKIGPKIVSEIRALSGKGMSSAEISDFLDRIRNIEYSPRRVREVVSGERWGWV